MQFATEQELLTYVDNELRKGLPSGWVFDSQPKYYYQKSYLQWEIVPPGEWGSIRNDYLLRVMPDYSTFIIIHGNNDAGLYGMNHIICNAKVIHARNFDFCSLSKIISHIIGNYTKNG